MKIKSALVTQMSGSIGGLTGSHNASGLYLRARTIPVNPNTALQQAVRSHMASLTSHWTSILTEVERLAWQAYADAVTLTNALGDPINVSGLAMFIRSNIPRLYAALTQQDDAPTIYNLGEFTAPVFAGPSEATQQVSMAFTAADAWVDEDGSAMLVYISRPQNQSINYFKGPYQLASTIEGDSVTPPTSPELIDLPFPFVAGQRVFVKVNVTRGDGRYSSPFRDRVLAVA